MRKSKLFIVSVCVLLIISALPVYCSEVKELTDKEEIVIQPKFTNIRLFENIFTISDKGLTKVVSTLDVLDADECSVYVYLQRYENGQWITSKNWSSKKSGNSCGLSETCYVMSGYQYRMKSYGYVYQDGKVVESTSDISQTILY